MAFVSGLAVKGFRLLPPSRHLDKRDIGTGAKWKISDVLEARFGVAPLSGTGVELDEQRVLAQGVDSRVHAPAVRDRDLLDDAAVAAQEPHEAGEVRATPRPRERDLGETCDGAACCCARPVIVT